MASGYYDITSKTLGKGHYGVVKLGRHCLTGEPVAMKIIEKSRLNNDSLNQLGTEIRILFRLSEYEHPNILKLYQTIDTEDKLFLVTEYCGPHACDLHDHLLKKYSREGLSEIEAQVFFIQICSAISYCHSMGIVHRDLKPENILVTDYRHMHTDPLDRSPLRDHQYPLLKLIDFGFANQWYPDEKMRTSCGTLAYSAPELLLGEPYDGTKVDVWGLGLMLYILLYGGNPFMQINDNETLTKILDCSFATPTKPNVDHDAVELLRSLIRRNPDSRLPIDAILRHKWFSAIPKPFEFMLKYQIKTEQSPSSKQLPKLAQPVVSPTLPSISESGPLKNLNRSVDDDQVKTMPTVDSSSETTNYPNYNRTRSLSITRTHSKGMQQQSLSQTKSSINLERMNQSVINVSSMVPLIPRGSPMYRPTSPDVGGGFLSLSDEEKKIHELVIQEMFRITKLIDSKSSIEASLKNARFAHRLFNQNSMQPTQLVKRKGPAGLIKSLTQMKASQGDQPENSSNGSVDKLSVINSKLNNDDYIYATYQLMRDKILRVEKEQIDGTRPNQSKNVQNVGCKKDATPSNREVILKEESVIQSHTADEQKDDTNGLDMAKENEDSQLPQQQQRKLLQPQHRMRDKFTSFFRSGSTSPTGSVSIQSCDLVPSSNGETSSPLPPTPDQHHEAFIDSNNETSGSTAGRYLSSKVDSLDNSMAYALPLARKCSLVSEESGCSNDVSDNQ